MRFPRSVQLKVKPVRLIALGESLGEPGGVLTARPEELVFWREELMGSGIQHLSACPFEPVWQRVLPYLALPGEPEEVRSRAMMLLLKHSERMRWSHLVFVAGNTLNPGLIRKIRKHPAAPERLPRWLEAFDPASSEPLAPLAQALWGEGASLSDGAKRAELPPACQAQKDLFWQMIRSAPQEVVRREARDWLERVQAKEWVDGQAIEVLTIVYGSLTSRSLGSTAVNDWYEAARAHFGASVKDHPGRWSRLPEAAVDLARRIEIRRAIDRFFGDGVDVDRAKYWRGKIDWITDFTLYDDAFMMLVGRRHVVEFKRVGNACYTYSKSEWQELLAKSRRVPDLKQSWVRHQGDHWLSHHSGWQSKFDAYIREHCL